MKPKTQKIKSRIEDAQGDFESRSNSSLENPKLNTKLELGRKRLYKMCWVT